MDRTWTAIRTAGQADKNQKTRLTAKSKGGTGQLHELKIQKKHCLHLLSSLNPDPF
jgi:hypothetical protein